MARRKEWGITTDKYGVSFWNDKNALKLDGIDGFMFCKYTKTLWITNFKKVNFMVCEVYLNFLRLKK